MSPRIVALIAWLTSLPLLLASCSYPGLPALTQDEADAGPDAPLVAEGPASCRALADTCGPGGTDDCCNSLLVPGGTFFRSFDYAGDAYSGTADFPAAVSSFHLDRYEVTVGRFRAFVMAGMGTQAKPPASGSGAHSAILDSGWSSNWNTRLPLNTDELLAQLRCGRATWSDSPGANESRPMNCLSWELAMAFCIWDGGYLPTEAEWNYAAAGGGQQRAYPWSVPASYVFVDYGRASYYNGSSCFADGLEGCDATDMWPVGRQIGSTGRWGHMDLAGNVREWLLDFGEPYQVPCVDCANLTGNGSRQVRGGSFRSDLLALRSGSRTDSSIEIGFFSYGARCARPLLE